MEWRVGIFDCLDRAENRAQDDRDPQTLLQSGAVAVQQCVVRPGHRGARQEQNDGVEQRKAERIDDFQSLGRPLPGDIGDRFGQAGNLIVHHLHRGGEQRKIKKRPEPAQEEHNFRGDEQNHAVTHVELNHRRVIARMRFTNHVAPPEKHRREHARQPGVKGDAARVGLVHPHNAARCQHERGHRPHQGPDAGRKNVIVVIFGTGH